MMRPTLSLVVSGLVLGVALAFAEPGFVLRYPGGVPHVSITGDYTGSDYTVWRQPASGGEAVRITERSILCLGSCYAEDRTAVAGESYLYLFEVGAPGGSVGAVAHFGPYLATISPALARSVGVFVYPNPGHGSTGIQLYTSGGPGDRPLEAEAAIYDLAGRRVRTVHRGPLARGLTTVFWDGRGESGERLTAGVYVLRFSAGGASSVARVIRF